MRGSRIGPVRIGAMAVGLAMFGWGLALAGQRSDDLVDVAVAAVFAALTVGSLLVVSAWAVHNGLGQVLGLFVALLAIASCVSVGLAGPEWDGSETTPRTRSAIVGGLVAFAATRDALHGGDRATRLRDLRVREARRIAVGGRAERLSIHV